MRPTSRFAPATLLGVRCLPLSHMRMRHTKRGCDHRSTTAQDHWLKSSNANDRHSIVTDLGKSYSGGHPSPEERSSQPPTTLRAHPCPPHLHQPCSSLSDGRSSIRASRSVIWSWHAARRSGVSDWMRYGSSSCKALYWLIAWRKSRCSRIVVQLCLLVLATRCAKLRSPERSTAQTSASRTLWRSWVPTRHTRRDPCLRRCRAWRCWWGDHFAARSDWCHGACSFQMLTAVTIHSKVWSTGS